MKLRKVRGTENPRYLHPNGWRIIRRERDYSLRGFPRGALGATEATAPKVWWEVSSQGRKPRNVVASFPTLRESREWCDKRNAYGPS
jgi:hypothetical protein